MNSDEFFALMGEEKERNDSRAATEKAMGLYPNIGKIEHDDIATALRSAFRAGARWQRDQL